MIAKARMLAQPKNDYPTSDGKPMAETELHRALMNALIETLKWWFADDPDAYVSGNLLICYEKGNKRIHVAPDVFMVRGVPNYIRENYLLWEERPLNMVIEITSRSTMMDDFEAKYNHYVDKLGVQEYFLFDPKQEYLKPSFQGYRKVKDRFRPIKPIEGRLPSKELGLHLERFGAELRLWNPADGTRLPTPSERANVEAERAEQEAERAEREAARAEQAEQENARLRHEIERLRGKPNGK
jgi:Uma2 family endonuclease